MTTEITAAVAYQIQNQNKFDNRWHNARSASADKATADETLISLRTNYPTTVWRLLLITTTTEVIA